MVMMTSDYIIVVTVELVSKNTYFKKLPNMVSLIAKPTLWLNLHQKTGLGGI